MFQENLKTLRRQRSLSQQALADRLHVVRQTISKWERGTSVPDAELLIRLAEELDTTVADLLGETISQPSDETALSQQLSQLNSILAERNRRHRRICRVVGLAVLCIILCFVLLIACSIVVFDHAEVSQIETSEVVSDS